MRRRTGRWERLSAEDLRTEQAHRLQRLQTPLSDGFIQLYRTELNAIETELARRAGIGVRASAPRPQANARPATTPSATATPSAVAATQADPIVRGDAAMRATTVTPLRLESEGARYLPADLAEALEVERSLYRPVVLRSASTSWEGDLLVLTPLPPPDDTWISGTLHGFSGAERTFVGDVVHLDPSAGRVFVLPRGPIGRTKSERWCLTPFDFSTGIVAAARASQSDRERLDRQLEAVCGIGLPTTGGGTPARPEDVWGLTWGFLWGPPGTGKTETLSRLLAGAVASGGRFLAVAPTNLAVDTLVRRVCKNLLARGVRAPGQFVFRGGTGAGADVIRDFPETVRSAERADELVAVDSLERRVAEATARGAHAAAAELSAELTERRRLLADATLFEAQSKRPLIVITVHRALRLVAELAGKPIFTKVVADEAGMISRAASALISLLAPSALFAGDPKQIGPVSRAEGTGRHVHRWLRTSALSHLDDAAAAQVNPNVALLRAQHRMHPDISKAVSQYTYGGMLMDADTVRTRSETPVPGFPNTRANWVVLSELPKQPESVFARRGENGVGYQRPLSAMISLLLARRALESGKTVLVLTPYRAQVTTLNELLNQVALARSRLVVSTIHRQQGTEADVVIVDTVAGGRPFPDDELLAMLNVGASRAREHLFLVAAPSEAERRAPGYLARILSPVQVTSVDPLVVAPTTDPFEIEVTIPARSSIGLEIDAIHARGTLFTQEQVALFRRQIDEGHHVVRGVAGSGKTYVLANWVAGVLEGSPRSTILVSYFNRALGPLIERLVRNALEGRGLHALTPQVSVRSVHSLEAVAPGSFDAVFVDEAQDMDGPSLNRLFSLARLRTKGDRGLRSFNLFMDDSQNVYGRQGLQLLRDAVGVELNFSGRSSVLREAFRSTRQILDLAFNVVLDPQGLRGAAPGMRQFMRAQELFEHNLLENPERTPDGMFHVLYTERTGHVPEVFVASTRTEEYDFIARSIQGLLRDEGLGCEDIVVVVPSRPADWAGELNRRGVRTLGFGGSGGIDASEFSTSTAQRSIRVTTLFQAKGHESPVVFFAGIDDIDNYHRWAREDRPPPGGKRSFAKPRPLQLTEREWEQRRRAMFYVGATRAMIRQYISGQKSDQRTPLVVMARRYSDLLRGTA